MEFSSIRSLEKFFEQLHRGEQSWDSIRRIPFSTPGRWVQSLDLSELAFNGQSQALLMDSLLGKGSPSLILVNTADRPQFVSSL